MFVEVVHGRGIVLHYGEQADDVMRWQSFQGLKRHFIREGKKYKVKQENAASPESAKKFRSMEKWSQESLQSFAARALAAQAIDNEQFLSLMKGTDIEE